MVSDASIPADGSCLVGGCDGLRLGKAVQTTVVATSARPALNGVEALNFILPVRQFVANSADPGGISFNIFLNERQGKCVEVQISLYSVLKHYSL